MPEAIAIMRIADPLNPGTCCPCAEQIGCSCSGNNCSLRCRARAGTATLCGFSEFGAPSTPPKLYRKYTIKSGAPFKICQLPDADCVPSDCASNFECSFSGLIPGIPFLVVFHGKWSYQGTTGGLAKYKAEVTATIDGSPAVGLMVAAPAAGPGGGAFADGDITGFTPGVIVGVGGSVVYVSGTPIPGCVGCIRAGASAVVVESDAWDYIVEYVRDPADPCSVECILQQTDNSLRTTSLGDSCNAAGGTTGPIGAPTPEEAYGGNATTTVVNNVDTETEGNGCVTPPGISPSLEFNGTVSELLTEEDTDQDAIDRAMICTPWSPTVGCLPEEGGTAFITPRTTDTTFGFRECQVRGTANDLIVGHDYKMTIGIYVRIYGTSGPFLPDSIIEISFTAEESPETTDWMLIPNQEGYESKAVTCNVVDVTGP